MVLSAVPDDGEILACGLTIRGRQIRLPDGAPLVWLSDSAYSWAGRIWADLARQSAACGLQPFLMAGMDADPLFRRHAEEMLGWPEDTDVIDGIDAAGLLRKWWWFPSPEDIAENPEDSLGMFAPYSEERFPGLAPAIDTEQGPEFTRRALVQCSRYGQIGLVPAARPADILPCLGWSGSVNSRTASELAVVLRSWEDRFGARLLEVGYADIRLLVSRPPRTLEEALPIAVEHFVFSDEAQQGLRYISEIARALVNNPFWDFWWD